MEINWWMIDGGVCLIILAAAIRGAARGIGDTVLRIAGILGGLALGTVYSGRVAEWLSATGIGSSIHDHIFRLIRGSDPGTEAGTLPDAAGQGAATGSGEGSLLDSLSSGMISFKEDISKSLGDIFSDAADKAADTAATRLTEIAVGIISFALIILAAALLVTLIRSLIRRGRKKSVVLGLADRTLGFVLGALRGLLLAWVAVALLIPITAWVSPANTVSMAEALRQTTIAEVLYDVNPILLLVKYVFRA